MFLVVLGYVVYRLGFNVYIKFHNLVECCLIGGVFPVFLLFLVSCGDLLLGTDNILFNLLIILEIKRLDFYKCTQPQRVCLERNIYNILNRKE